METKKCSYCGGEIMSAARKCKHCGRWLEDRANQLSPSGSAIPTDKFEKAEIRQSNSKTILWLVLAALVLAFVIWIISIEQEKSEYERYLRENHLIGLVMEEDLFSDIQVLTPAKTEPKV